MIVDIVLTAHDSLAVAIIVVAWCPLSMVVGGNLALAFILAVEGRQMGAFVRDLDARWDR